MSHYFSREEWQRCPTCPIRLWIESLPEGDQELADHAIWQLGLSQEEGGAGYEWLPTMLPDGRLEVIATVINNELLNRRRSGEMTDFLKRRQEVALKFVECGYMHWQSACGHPDFWVDY